MNTTEQKKEWEKLGHITETGKCVICGEVYHNYGKATWGYWDEDPINYPLGEDKRCCEKCYREEVVPARAEKLEKKEKEKLKGSEERQDDK